MAASRCCGWVLASRNERRKTHSSLASVVVQLFLLFPPGNSRQIHLQEFAANSLQMLDYSDRPESPVGGASFRDHCELKLSCLAETNMQDIA